MLVEFQVANFRSLKLSQTLSFVASSSTEHKDTHVIGVEAPGTPDLLRSAVLYGPNASGKSNVLMALSVMRDIVVRSAQARPDDDLPVEPYLLCNRTSQLPTEFQCVFIAEGTRYQYGFTATRKQVMSEWLIGYPNGRAQKLFEREPKTESESEWTFGEKFIGRKATWVLATRPNALFLSTAIQLNNSQMLPIFNWFRYTLMLITDGGDSLHQLTAHMLDNTAETENSVVLEKREVLEFLAQADFDVVDFDVKREKFNPDSIPSDMPPEIVEIMSKFLSDAERFEISLRHRTEEGEARALTWGDESHGTQKLFALAGPWIQSVKRNRILVIDELSAKLHPKLVQFLVQRFHLQSIDSRAQLLCATHETSILSQRFLRRDQIWFCERVPESGTQLYPLTDFKPKKNRENLEYMYLAGRYGAVPFVEFATE